MEDAPRDDGEGELEFNLPPRDDGEGDLEFDLAFATPSKGRSPMLSSAPRGEIESLAGEMGVPYTCELNGAAGVAGPAHWMVWTRAFYLPDRPCCGR